METTWGKGLTGESIARSYLEKQGFRILASNWRYGNHLEIDIVALSPEKELVAVEVRTHTTPQNYAPFESVDSRKIKRIKKALTIFLHKSDLSQDIHCRVDVIGVVESTGEIEHFEAVDIGLPDWRRP